MKPENGTVTLRSAAELLLTAANPLKTVRFLATSVGASYATTSDQPAK